MPDLSRSRHALVLRGFLAALAFGVPVAAAAPAVAASIPIPEPDQEEYLIARAPVLVPKPTWQLPVDDYHITGTFGASSSLWSSTHTGLDFATDEGTPIHAVTDGVVVSVEYDGSYGNKTVIRMDDGTEVWYCHQSETTVTSGQSVDSGDEIGAVGSTGNVTGPHLHLEFRTADEPQDPDAVLREHGLDP
ncbi:MAG: M23 family metallopeptidase [Nocardioides sp.]|nr:M23 family metallopeptidase [Nocardioides sp.]